MSKSERYLAKLADRTFLKPWAIANPFHRPGKELTDLLVPFGDDIILFSDKACRFRDDQPLETAWGRWSRATIDESLKQLGGALRVLDRPDCTVFTDNAGKDPLAYPPSPHEQRRYHLVAVARPDLNPDVRPMGWKGLTYSDQGPEGPFRIGPRRVGGHFVHILDGADLELLLDRLDTAPDLIAYLASRARALGRRPGVTFREPDLLALAINNWMNGQGHTVGLDAAELRLLDGAWARYEGSEREAKTREASRDSYQIDQLIEAFHDEYLVRRAAGGGDPERHEEAMRLLAQENRFARRMIVSTLVGLVDEPDRKTFWAGTTPSPTANGLRYLWLVYPPKPDHMPDPVHIKVLHDHLSQHMIVAADTFDDTTMVVGLAFPNRAVEDVVLIMRVLAVERTTALKAEAAYWRDKGIFSDLEPEHRLHVP